MIETAEPDDDSFCFARVSPKMNHDYQPGPFHTVVTIEGLGFDWQRGGGGSRHCFAGIFWSGRIGISPRGDPPPPRKNARISYVEPGLQVVE